MMKLATFAGGCFWCMVKPFDHFEGVADVLAGFTGGHVPHPTYHQVCAGDTGHAEAVQISYDAGKIGYESLLDAFWSAIDPTDAEGQFNDRGASYRPAIYYHDAEQRRLAEASKAELQRLHLFPKDVVVPVLPAQPFYPAEDSHQNYYCRNRSQYDRYYVGSGRKPFLDSLREKRLRAKLSPEAVAVVRDGATERPFSNPLTALTDDGVYVDVVSGEVLFSSRDKFDSGCGWPSFARPLLASQIEERRDGSHGMERVEVRSRTSDSHLGHVFQDGPAERGGLRYCINGAALRFVPKEKMAEKGFAEYLELFQGQ